MSKHLHKNNYLPYGIHAGKWMVNQFLFVSLFSLFSVTLSGQNPALVTEHDRLILLELADSFHQESTAARIRARQEAQLRGWPVQFTSREGVGHSLQRIENGLPLYYRTYNRNAAVTSGANKLHPRAARRLFLTGQPMLAGVWDEGRVYHNHLEFGGRVINKNPATAVSDHATHVAGTIAAAGIDAGARGMAYESMVHSYDWDDDVNEMIVEATEGLLLSNHSYGFALGWEMRDGKWTWMGADDAQEDYRFGYYSGVSRNLDIISYYAPFYQIVWGAGNHRNDNGDGTRPPDGPYDCLGPHAVAKNVLTVGAVFGLPGPYRSPEEVRMTAFSSWGPTDDGRIKPDVVAKGQAVRSTIPDDDYGTRSGTSMAAPVATGSLLLIQQLYNELSGGDYLRASSLRGLAIHTANEAGVAPGPDYSFGWGLLDVGNMADMLLAIDDEQYVFREEILYNDSVYSIAFTSEGNHPIKATIAWTDPPGVPVPGQPLNARDPMLVNDLDLRIISDQGDTLYPWILDVERPAASATTGDNMVDNVEQVFIAEPASGNYFLHVSHKGDTLIGGKQHFSLFLHTKSLPGPRDNFYWIGGNGNWNDGNNWALRSGGDPVGRVPGADDHVVVDKESFRREGQRITLDTEVFCYSLTFEEEAIGNIDLNGNELNIFNTMYASKDPFLPGTEGFLVFMGNRKDGRLMYPTEELSPHIELVFDNPEGRWRLFPGLRAKKITLRGGSLTLDNLNIVVEELVAYDNDVEKRLTMKHATLEGLRRVDLSAENMHVEAEGSTLLFGDRPSEKDDHLMYLSMPNAKINTLEFYADLEVHGLLGMEHMISNASLYLQDTIEAYNVSFGASSAFYLAEDATFYIDNSISRHDETSTRVAITGQNNAMFIGREIRLYCLDHLEVNGVGADGNAFFNAGPNSVLTNAPGWFNTNCSDILFADFDVLSPCVYSWTTFTDNSSGAVALWSWLIDENHPSSDASLQLTFTETGDIPVLLAVQNNAGDTHTNTRTISIEENPFPEFTVVKSANNVLISSIIAPKYQWYKDGVPIDGATNRMYNYSDDSAGTYIVLISDDRCNRPSANDIFTGLSNHLSVSEGLKVYPNPASGNLHIESLHPIDELMVFDMLGKLVFNATGSGHSHQLNVYRFDKGIYTLRIITAQGVGHAKFQVFH